MQKLIHPAVLLFAATVISIFTSCTKSDILLTERPKEQIEDASHLTILQSRLFFEEFAAGHAAKTKSADDNTDRLVIGEFIPKWDNAVTSDDGIIGCVDLPIESQMRYMAIRQCNEGGITCQSRTPLYQKLIFVKNDTLNTIFPYLLSLIPDKDFYLNHREEDMADNFINLGDKGGFCGLAIYTTPYTGYLVRTSRFDNGKYTDGAFVFDPSHPLDENADKADALLKGIMFVRISAPVTKNEDKSQNGETLNEVVVTAYRNNDKEVEQETDDEADYEEERGWTDPGGGGGGSGFGNGNSSVDSSDNESSSDNDDKETPEVRTVTVGEPVNGTVSGGGDYALGSTARLSATPNEGYVFAGWSGDYSGLDNPASFTVKDDMTIYAKFYEEDSECGKLVKNLESLPYMTRCREKIGSGTGLTEYGYIKTSGSIEELTGRDNAIHIPDMPNTIELAHTHIDVIHPSIDDLKSIYRRYYKGCISDYENFKYIIVSPKYFVILKIEDTDRMDVLIRDSLIIQKVYLGNNKYKYEFSENIGNKYDEYIPVESNSVEGHFSNFMRFFEYLNPGLSVSIYRTDEESGNMIYKKVNNKEDFNNLINKIGICNN